STTYVNMGSTSRYSRNSVISMSASNCSSSSSPMGSIVRRGRLRVTPGSDRLQRPSALERPNRLHCLRHLGGVKRLQRLGVVVLRRQVAGQGLGVGDPPEGPPVDRRGAQADERVPVPPGPVAAIRVEPVLGEPPVI